MRRLAFVVLLAAAAALLAGCKPPAVEFENLHLVSSLRTACSAQNEQWLAGVEKAVNLRHEEGRMSDTERDHFAKLIALAREGNWEEADRRCFDFEAAQLNRRRSRPAGDDDHTDSHRHVRAPADSTASTES
jgi:hypothetical protein